MSNKPLVSIITPCYNGEKFLDRYFNAILSQTYDNLELIFVNDGSSDRTEEIVFSYRDELKNKGVEFIYIYQENAGLAASINKALKFFKGDYLTWPDCDDWMPRDMIEKQVEYLSQNPNKCLVLNKCQYVSEDDYVSVIKERTRNNKSKYHIFEDLISHRDIYWAAGAVMINAKHFLAENPQRDIFEGLCGQNYQMMLPIAYKYECGFLDYPVYNILSRGDSHSRNLKTPQEAYEYNRRNEETLLQTLYRIQMTEEEKERYIRLAKYECAKKRFYLAIEFCDRNNVKKFYKEMKLNGKITLKMYVQYVIFKNSFLSKIYNIITQKS